MEDNQNNFSSTSPPSDYDPLQEESWVMFVEILYDICPSDFD